LVRANLKSIALRRAALFAVTIGDKAAKRLPSPSPIPIHSHTDAQPGLLILNSAPNEATTSIWLKAMMVSRDLSGNTEQLENESGTEVERWIEPEGRSPEGQVGVDSARRAIC
jgi:hypothetical protein